MFTYILADTHAVICQQSRWRQRVKLTPKDDIAERFDRRRMPYTERVARLMRRSQDGRCDGFT